MGRVVTPKFRVEYRTNLLAMGITAPDCRSNVDGKPVNIMSWGVHGTDPRKGKAPTVADLEEWRKTWNKSFAAGGTNAHVSKAFEAVMHISWARVVRNNNTNRVVCEVTMPTFEVV